MPRPNPEAWAQTVLWTSNYAGSKQTNKRTYHRSYTSVNTPGFPSNIGNNAHTMELMEQWLDPTASWSSENLSPYSVTWATGPMDGSSRGVQATYRQHFADLSSVKSRAKAKLAHAVKRDKVNLAVSLAEAGQAKSLFGSTAKRIADAYRALRRGDIRGLRRSINVHPSHSASLLRRGPLDVRRHAPTIWLEMQYGWKPLLSDLYGAVTQLHSRVEEGYPIHARASSRETRNRHVKDNNTTGVVSCDVFQEQRSMAKYGVWFWVDSSSSANLNDWGLTNPLEVVWELVPYSFVVDWFIPIGDYLSTFDAYLGATFQRGYEVTVRQTQSVARYKPVASPFNRRYNARGIDSFKQVSYQRVPLSGFPSVGLPRFKNPISKVHVANALSLLSLAFDRTLKYR